MCRSADRAVPPMAPASRVSRRWSSSPRPRRLIPSRKELLHRRAKRAVPAKRGRPFLLGDWNARVVLIKDNKRGWTMRAFLLATALVLTPVAAYADLAISGQDGKQVRAGDGLPMVPTPDSVALIEFSSAKAPKVIGSINVCSTQMGPPSALAVAPDYSFVLATCPQKFGPDKKLMPENTVSVIGLDNPTHPKLLQTVQAGTGATGVYLNKKATIAL